MLHSIVCLLCEPRQQPQTNNKNKPSSSGQLKLVYSGRNIFQSRATLHLEACFIKTAAKAVVSHGEATRGESETLELLEENIGETLRLRDIGKGFSERDSS